MLKLPKLLAAVARFAARDATKYTLNALRLSETAEGYEVQATDGRRLAVVKGPGREEATLAMLADAPKGATAALVPAKEFADALKQAKKIDHVFAVLGSQQTTFAAGNKVVTIENVEGRWPNFDIALPKKAPAVEFTIDAALFAELLDVASALSLDKVAITLRYWKKDVPVVVTAAADGIEFFGLQMPLS
jgi:DNA polymerase III sliding clamp (beta) subunit (PCNA family)